MQQNFNNNLFQKLYHLNLGQSFTFSPLSIKLAFANLLNGTTGDTRREIIDCLGLPADQDQINSQFKDITQKLQNNNYSQVNIANSVWLNPKYQFSADFLAKSIVELHRIIPD